MQSYDKELVDKIKEGNLTEEDIKRVCERYIQEVDDREDGRDVFYAKKMEDYLNSCPNFGKFIEYMTTRCHRYLQNEFLKLVMKVIEVVGVLDLNRHTDGRNEWSYKQMRKLLELGAKENILYKKRTDD